MRAKSQVALVVKNLPANAGDIRDMGSISGSERSPGEGNGNPLQYSHGQRSLAGYGPQGCKESDMTEATEHTSTSTEKRRAQYNQRALKEM